MGGDGRSAKERRFGKSVRRGGGGSCTEEHGVPGAGVWRDESETRRHPGTYEEEAGGQESGEVVGSSEGREWMGRAGAEREKFSVSDCSPAALVCVAMYSILP